MITPQLLTNAPLDYDGTQVGPGTTRPIGITADTLAQWIWNFTSWRFDMVGVFDSATFSRQNYILVNNNLFGPGEQSALCFPDTAGTSHYLYGAGMPTTVTFELLTGQVMFDPVRNLYWPTLIIALGSSLTSNGFGASVGNARLCGIPVPMYNGMMDSSAILEFTPHATW